jgi:hypothetical protein
MADYPKALYRGAYHSHADLESAWRLGGVESMVVLSEAEELAALDEGWVVSPRETVGDSEPMVMSANSEPIRRRGRPPKVRPDGDGQ